LKCNACGAEKKYKKSLWILLFLVWIGSGVIIMNLVPGISAFWAVPVTALTASVLHKSFLICPECLTPGKSDADDIGKNMAKLEKFWSQNESTPLPDEARQVVLNGGSVLEAVKAGRRTIGKSDTIAGAFKDGLNRQKHKEGL